MRTRWLPLLLLWPLPSLCGAPSAQQLWLVVEGGPGPGHGRQIVLIGGDEEYRSEEALPQLARMLRLRFQTRGIERGPASRTFTT